MDLLQRPVQNLHRVRQNARQQRLQHQLLLRLLPVLLKTTCAECPTCPTCTTETPEVVTCPSCPACPTCAVYSEPTTPDYITSRAHRTTPTDECEYVTSSSGDHISLLERLHS